MSSTSSRSSEQNVLIFQTREITTYTRFKYSNYDKEFGTPVRRLMQYIMKLSNFCDPLKLIVELIVISKCEKKHSVDAQKTVLTTSRFTQASNSILKFIRNSRESCVRSFDADLGLRTRSHVSIDEQSLVNLPTKYKCRSRKEKKRIEQ